MMAQQPEGTGESSSPLEIKRALGGGDGPEISSVPISIAEGDDLILEGGEKVEW